MNNKNQHPKSPWQSPQITSLSISLDTKQDGEPLNPPNAGQQS
jgi:hypothetical protein